MLTRLHPRSALGALIRLPLRLIPHEYVIRVRAGVNKDMKWIAGSSIHGCWLGTYEHEKQVLVSALARPGMVVWDIGANAGFYTLAFSRLVGAGGHVYAFEPIAENTHNLLRHVRLNCLTNTTVIQAALAAQTELVGFQTASSNSMGQIGAAGDYMVPAISADSFLRKHPASRPQLLKVDIEGAEALLLTGAKELLTSAAPEILLALHGEAQAIECRNILGSYGYSLYYLNGSLIGNGPITDDEILATKSAFPYRIAAIE
ncbi:MAG: FkbM family methyltransferase [Nevskiales bacterium]